MTQLIPVTFTFICLEILLELEKKCDERTDSEQTALGIELLRN